MRPRFLASPARAAVLAAALLAAAVAVAPPLATPAAAQTVTFDFQGETAGPVPGAALAYAVPGFGTATFTAMGLQVLDLSPSYPDADRVLGSLGFVVPIRLTFSGFTAGTFSVRNPIYGLGPAAEIDVIKLAAFAADGSLVGSVTGSGAGQQFLTLIAPAGAAWLTIDDVGTGFVADDVVIGGLALPGDPTVTPEPATWALMGSGLVGFALVRRRRWGASRGAPSLG